MSWMLKLGLVAAGGALGAVLRYVVSGAGYALLGERFPWGTLVVNLLGSFVLGVLWGLSLQAPLDPRLRTFLLVGLLGAFTTFSTFSLESYVLLRDGELALALANLFGSVLGGLLAVVAGIAAARAVVAPTP